MLFLGPVFNQPILHAEMWKLHGVGFSFNKCRNNKITQNIRSISLKQSNQVCLLCKESMLMKRPLRWKIWQNKCLIWLFSSFNPFINMTLHSRDSLGVSEASTSLHKSPSASLWWLKALFLIQNVDYCTWTWHFAISNSELGIMCPEKKKAWKQVFIPESTVET